jgi:phenylalanyl-tRNA synthetase beta chain
VSHNRRHGRRDVRLFEIGTRFSRRGESRGAAAAWTGLATPEHWSSGQREVDFFDVKGAAEQIVATFELAATFAPVVRPYLVEGRAADVLVDGTVVGVIGQLNPAIGEARELPRGDALYVMELDLDAISAKGSNETRFAQPLPRHPSVIRDVSILVDDTLSADTVRGTIRSAAPPALVDVREFDRYQGKGIPDGKVSLSLRLTFRAHDRTLTDAEVSAAMDSIVRALTETLGAIQR